MADDVGDQDKETILSHLKEEFNIIQQKRALLKEHDAIIKE
jgi:hypothetical protein